MSVDPAIMVATSAQVRHGVLPIAAMV